MVKIREAIVVEGKYDKIRLSQVVDTVIIPVCGFRIFSDGAKVGMIKAIAGRCGVIILTDSDGAGLVIRNYLKNVLEGVEIKQAYIPELRGKERRKAGFSKEGKLGVEAMSAEIIINALKGAGAVFEGGPAKQGGNIKKADIYQMGLLGGQGSGELRRKLCKRLRLPEYLSSNSLLQTLNILFEDKAELKEFAEDPETDSFLQKGAD